MTQMRKNLHLFKQHTLEIWTTISQKNKSTNTSGSFESASEKKELSIKIFFSRATVSKNCIHCQVYLKLSHNGINFFTIIYQFYTK